jgi:hypothetical protein
MAAPRGKSRASKYWRRQRRQWITRTASGENQETNYRIKNFYPRGREKEFEEVIKMLAKGSWTKVSIEINGNNQFLCADLCKWHRKRETHCDLFDQDLHKEKYQQKFTRCLECKIGTTSNPYSERNMAGKKGDRQ